MKQPLKKQSPPWLLLQWQKLYWSLPKVYIPFTLLDCGVSLIAMVFLIMVRCVGLFTLFYLGWPDSSHEDYKITWEASGSIPAIVHSLLLVPALVVALVSQPYVPSSAIQDTPLWYQDAVVALLQLCTGYMIYDALVSYVWGRWDYELQRPVWDASDISFVGHHFATTFYMTATRVLGAGHVSAMICMAIGEATNPFQNSFLISQSAQTLDCCNGPLAKAIHPILQVTFCLLYCLARIVVGPILMLHVTYDVALAKTNIPVNMKFLWIAMIWGVVFGSVPWIQECWETLETQLFHSSSNNQAEL